MVQACWPPFYNRIYIGWPPPNKPVSPSPIINMKKYWNIHHALFVMTSPFIPSENSGVPLAEIAGPFLAEGVASDCTASVSLREPVMWVIAYALMAICALVLIILLILLILPCRRHRDGEITDESSLVRHRIKWRQGSEEISGQVTGVNILHWTLDEISRSHAPVLWDMLGFGHLGTFIVRFKTFSDENKTIDGWTNQDYFTFCCLF